MSDGPAPRQYQPGPVVPLRVKVRPEVMAALRKEAAQRGVTMGLVASECLTTSKRLDVEDQSC